MNILIKNVTAVTMRGDSVVQSANIAIENGKISYIGAQIPKGEFARIIDGSGKVAMPGLINAHTHVPMTLLRGFADGYDLQTWLNDHIFPAEAKMDEKCVRLGATLGIAECLRFGITSISDMYFKIKEIANAAIDAGIKANICNGALCFDRENYDFNKAGETAEMREALASWHNSDDGRIKLDVGIHAEYTSFDALWRANADFAKKHGLNIQAHISETQSEHSEAIVRNGATPLEMMRKAGVLDSRLTAAHCVYASEQDMEIMKENNGTAAHCPVSNLKLASGVANTEKMAKIGANFAIGTDGVSSNNSHDMFEEIKLCSILQKEKLRDAQAMPAMTSLHAATVGGAFAQGRERECGRLEVGLDADIILIDFYQPQLQPVNNVVSSLCYSVSGRDVCLTMVRGKILYENGIYTTIDIEKTMHEINNYALPKIMGK